MFRRQHCPDVHFVRKERLVGRTMLYQWRNLIVADRGFLYVEIVLVATGQFNIDEGWTTSWRGFAQKRVLFLRYDEPSSFAQVRSQNFDDRVEWTCMDLVLFGCSGVMDCTRKEQCLSQRIELLEEHFHKLEETEL